MKWSKIKKKSLEPIREHINRCFFSCSIYRLFIEFEIDLSEPGIGICANSAAERSGQKLIPFISTIYMIVVLNIFYILNNIRFTLRYKVSFIYSISIIYLEMQITYVI